MTPAATNVPLGNNDILANLNSKYNSADEHNIHNLGDSVTPGATVGLLDEEGEFVRDENGIAITTSADENGMYNFPGLPPGNHQVVIVQAEGKEQTTPHSHTHGPNLDSPSDNAPPHANDPVKMKEHMALLDLMPAEDATHVAVKNGSWFDPATWGGEVPPAGSKVLIPTGITVRYDGESDKSIKIVRVDGKLQFSHDKNTKIVVDTLITTPKSHLQIGTKDNPVQADKTAQILIDGSKAINKVWDTHSD